MEPGALISQMQTDFESVSAGEFSDAVTITDGDDTVELRGLFDEGSIDVDPETQAQVITPDYRVEIAETSTAFKLRRKGLLVTIRLKVFKVRNWEFDGIGSVTLYLDEQKGEASATVSPVHIQGSRTEYFQVGDVIDGDSVRLQYIPLAGRSKVFSRGERLVEGTHWEDNHDGTITFLDLDWLPIGEDFVTVDYEIF